jgi:hypothetical protein
MLGFWGRAVPSWCRINGNNVVLAGDFPRRIISARLDPRVENPELRVFGFDPLEYAREHRAELIAAALTILLAYHHRNDGWKCDLPPLGSFGDWSRAVRDPLVWLGLENAVDTQKTARAADFIRGDHEELMSCWLAAYPSLGDSTATTSRTTPITAARLIELAQERAAPTDLNSPWKRPELHEAVAAIATVGGKMSGRSLSRFLMTNREKVVGGMFIGVSDQKAQGGKAQFYVAGPAPKKEG